MGVTGEEGVGDEVSGGFVNGEDAAGQSASPCGAKGLESALSVAQQVPVEDAGVESRDGFGPKGVEFGEDGPDLIGGIGHEGFRNRVVGTSEFGVDGLVADTDFVLGVAVGGVDAGFESKDDTEHQME